ncbi:hypothetical protein [Lentzea cavernae]|uniref:Uncharacterized protein n=1 Tax=Lentzea cavernae TaxID=2020703 RepID=A0ABQ3MVW8_9PSEU|nr:hypothetical protein [Lentzea cavernae]GHH62387.1 hypothetical protein GCM10017774_90040 [Lentzea cavernae]
MTPTQDNESALTAPVQLSRLQRAHRRFPLRRRGSSRLSTVWLCAQDDLCGGTGLLANWLSVAIVKIVTTYTRPGNRVLLVEPTPSGTCTASALHNESCSSPYAGLHEAAWTVVRLGRGVQTQTDFRPSLVDLFDLIITATGTGSWHEPNLTGLADSLTSAGTLAVIARGERATDPAGSLVRSGRHAGLRFVDRIALMRTPADERSPTTGTPLSDVRASSPMRFQASRVRHTPAHDDLFVFARQPSLTAATKGERSGDV